MATTYPHKVDTAVKTGIRVGKSEIKNRSRESISTEAVLLLTKRISQKNCITIKRKKKLLS